MRVGFIDQLIKSTSVLWKYNEVAEKAQLAKETLYGSLWDHEGGIIPFAYDSAGNP
jgi:hypothetical protein